MRNLLIAKYVWQEELPNDNRDGEKVREGVLVQLFDAFKALISFHRHQGAD